MDHDKEPSEVDPDPSEIEPESELDAYHKDIHTFRIKKKVVTPKPEKKDMTPLYPGLDEHIAAIEAGSDVDFDDDSIQMNDAYPDTPNTIRKVYNCPDKSNDPDSREAYFKAVENQVKKDIEVLTSMIKNPEKPIKYNRNSQSNPSNVELSDNISDMLMRSETLKRIITSAVTEDSMDYHEFPTKKLPFNIRKRIDETHGSIVANYFCCLDEEVKQILVARLGVADAIRDNVPDAKQRMDTTRDILATLRETNNDPEAPQITSLMKALRMTAEKTTYFAKMSAAKRQLEAIGKAFKNSSDPYYDYCSTRILLEIGLEITNNEVAKEHYKALNHQMRSLNKSKKENLLLNVETQHQQFAVNDTSLKVEYTPLPLAHTIGSAYERKGDRELMKTLTTAQHSRPSGNDTNGNRNNNKRRRNNNNHNQNPRFHNNNSRRPPRSRPEAWQTDLSVSELADEGYKSHFDHIPDNKLHDHIGQPQDIDYDTAMNLPFDKRPLQSVVLCVID
ncbi:unnamed protein product [Ambrosiozyma monospora]|uniref:Unnamed protein product n=1 Tax=Ambrosiozyma monospora TaxID=43982 RepID=A0A9W6YPM4_AMBMO|nr:unnamed protein product [Ambrosiozyma monospora]